ncbi:DUF4153 domain-containing protein [Pokkaliibacter sp. MBI-7]|uniref:DUF4153 domain-containing protein n=1 Tax=Pokkaliibacter sp. MBI-7 TaxID=3040600 RepID=UPI00244772FC|nr:DUF4153 domain-containing protein [Pokkaliibacter sp. MBI-7]MDH2435329.1 DUF4153 domain-containing protein [Pokkaliibacter sp. MBI-7]
MSFVRLFTLTGALQGIGVWWLFTTVRDGGWPATQPVLLLVLIYVLCGMPLLIYGTQQVEGLPSRQRGIWVGVITALIAVLGATSQWGIADDGKPDLLIADAFITCVLAFVLLQLLCGYDFTGRRWSYERMFYYAWRNGLLYATAALMTGIFWGVLAAGVGLMSLVGVTWIKLVVTQPAFICCATATTFATAVSLGLTRAGMTESIRRFLLSIAAWMLPLVLVFSVIWTLALPVTGLTSLFETRSAAFLMLAFTAMAVLFVNCAYQEGSHIAYPGWLAWLLQGAWLTMLVVVAVAWWALGLRIVQHGWSEYRIWAAMVATLATVYVVGYSLSWYRRQRWMQAAGITNIVAAMLLCASLLVFSAPPTHIRKLAVTAHLAHVQALAEQGDKGAVPDWDYLRWSTGRYGLEALKQLESGQHLPAGVNWGQKAKAMLVASDEPDAEDKPPLTEAELEAQLKIFPTGKGLPAGFIAAIRSSRSWELRQCEQKESDCHVWMGDLNGDGQDEVALFNGRYGASVFNRQGATWQRLGHLESDDEERNIQLPQLNEAKPVAPLWHDLQVGNTRLQLRMNR